jgi:hypothetical protein
MTIHAIGLTTLNNTAKDFRNDMSVTMFGATAARPTGGRSGVRYGTPTNTVSLVSFAGTIKPHSGIMDVQTAAAAGPYFYAVTANEAFTVSAAHATLPRVDIVTIRINDNVEDASGLESATAHYKAGTAAASPVAPSPDTTRELVIAQINVPASGGGSPTVSWVAPTAVAAGGIIPVRNDTERDALHTSYPATTDAPLIVWRKDAATFEYTGGTGWQPLAGNYRPANAAALAALTGMLEGAKAYQVDTKVTYRYNGSAWKAWESDWITYTPTLTNFAIGTGGSAANSCAYRYEQGTVRVSFKFQFGTSGFSVSGDPIFTLPLNSAALAHTYVKRQGQAELWDSSGASISREAVIYQNAANLDKVMLYGLGTATAGTVYNISSTLPFTWAAADILAGEFTYTAA